MEIILTEQEMNEIIEDFKQEFDNEICRDLCRRIDLNQPSVELGEEITGFIDQAIGNYIFRKSSVNYTDEKILLTKLIMTIKYKNLNLIYDLLKSLNNN